MVNRHPLSSIQHPLEDPGNHTYTRWIKGDLFIPRSLEVNFAHFKGSRELTIPKSSRLQNCLPYVFVIEKIIGSLTKPLPLHPCLKNLAPGKWWERKTIRLSFWVSAFLLQGRKSVKLPGVYSNPSSHQQQSVMDFTSSGPCSSGTNHPNSCARPRAKATKGWTSPRVPRVIMNTWGVRHGSPGKTEKKFEDFLRDISGWSEWRNDVFFCKKNESLRILDRTLGLWKENEWLVGDFNPFEKY